MAEKYYTPDINEFAIGLECEIKKIAGREITWEPTVINERNIGWIISKFKSVKMDGPQIRIKYLDSDDIHSCGFETQGNGNRLWKNAKNYSLVHNPGGVVVIEDDADDCLFYGKIKNKSELKKLLQMLEIK